MPTSSGELRFDQNLMSLPPASQIVLPKLWRHGLTLPSEKLFIIREDRTTRYRTTRCREREIEEANCIRLGVGSNRAEIIAHNNRMRCLAEGVTLTVAVTIALNRDALLREQEDSI